MKYIFIILFTLAFNCSSFAQDSSANNAVIIHKDPRVELLMKRQADINTAVKKASIRSGKGYRLLVIKTNSRDDAMSARAKIHTYFPDQKSYLQYQSPFFKLKVGNYQTREEAIRFQKILESMFPAGVFIINDTIEIKPEKEEDI